LCKKKKQKKKKKNTIFADMNYFSSGRLQTGTTAIIVTEKRTHGIDQLGYTA